MKKIFLFFLFAPLISFTQNHFYLGAGLISSFANTEYANSNISSRNLTDFGLYYGNEIRLNRYLKTSIEVFYLNNQVVLAKINDKRFELHQNIGLKLKPGVYFGKNTIFLSLGLSGVYVFDKKERLGDQFDHFDEAFCYGIEYQYNFSDAISFNLGYLYSKFESLSHYTQHKLIDFSVMQLTFYYNLY